MRETLLAYLITIGGGSKVNVLDDASFFKDSKNAIDDLVQNFDETKMSAKSIKLSPELLDFLNRRFIRLKLVSKYESEKLELINEVRNLVRKKYSSNLNEAYLDENYITSILNWAKDRIFKLNDLVEENKFSFLWTDLSSQTQITPDKKLIDLIEVLSRFCEKTNINFNDSDLLKKEISSLFKKIDADSSKPAKNKEKSTNYWKLARIILTGNQEGASLVEIVQVLGKENLINRLNVAKKYCIDNLKPE